MRPIRLTIEGAPAAGRIGAIEAALVTVPGVLRVQAEPSSPAVSVEAAEEVDPDALIAALREAGFTAALAA